MLFLVYSNVVVQGGIYADNKFGIDIDRAENIKVDGARVIGESESYRALIERARLSKFVCNAPHRGIELHTRKQDPENEGVLIENVDFSGFDHLPCADAVPFSMDDTVSAQNLSPRNIIAACHLTYAFFV